MRAAIYARMSTATLVASLGCGDGRYQMEIWDRAETVPAIFRIDTRTGEICMLHFFHTDLATWFQELGCVMPHEDREAKLEEMRDKLRRNPPMTEPKAGEQ